MAADAADFEEKGGRGSAIGHTFGVKVQKVQRAQKGRFLGWTGLTAGGFLSLTGPLAPRVVVAASPQYKKGARLTPWVVKKGSQLLLSHRLRGEGGAEGTKGGRGLWPRRFLRFSGLTGLSGPRVVGRLRRRFYKPPSADPFRLSAPLPTP